MEEKKGSKKVVVFLVVLLGLLLVLGIGLVVAFSARTPRSDSVVYNESVDYTSPLSLGSKLSRSYDYDALSAAPSDMNQDYYEGEERSLTKTGEISVAVDDIDESLGEVRKIGKKYGAMVMNLDDLGKGVSRRVDVTIKVEQSRFEVLYENLKELEGEFSTSSIAVSDVTERVLDLEARLKNYQSVETQYLKILEKANTVEETLAVYKELNQVRLQIEMIETQLKNLATQTDYSYIRVRISQSSTGAEIVDQGWKPLGVLKASVRLLVSFMKLVGSLLIFLLVFTPVIAIVAVPVVILKKRAKK